AAYRVNPIEALIIKPLIRIPSVILANLVLGQNVVPEFLQNDATPQRLADEVIALIGDTPARRIQIEAFGKLDNIMQIGRLRPSERAADIVIEVARRRGGGR
ncbi:MAG: lipid-A-disaccharide synthase, partial [Pseudolabrys sp.]|nr:lipid-A-disaccharide synthase [Pseudolabrys sp.]